VYPIVGQVFVNPLDNSVFHSLLALPVPFQLKRGWVYAPIYAGCLWYIGITRGVLADDELRLRTNGDLMLPTVSIRRIPRIAEIMFRNRNNQRDTAKR
jgi:hypothetical protein